MPGEALEPLGNAREINRVTTSLRQHRLETRPLDEHGFANASNVAFNSLPPMHITRQANVEDMQSSENQISHPSDPGGKVFSKSCPESLTYEGSSDSFTNKGFPSPHQMEAYAQKKSFSPHWSLEAINEASEVNLTPILMSIFYSILLFFFFI